MRDRPVVFAVAIAYGCGLFWIGWLGADDDAQLSTVTQIGFMVVVLSSVAVGAVMRRGFVALALSVFAALLLYEAVGPGAVSNEVWILDLVAKALLNAALFYLGSRVATRPVRS